jgi:hypothetical protein
METSGRRRKPAPIVGKATPPMVPVCQVGRVVKILMPPPPEARGLVDPAATKAASSFQTISGM